MRTKGEARAKLRDLLRREWRRPHIEYKVPPPQEPGSQLTRNPNGHDFLLSPLSYRDQHILNRAKIFLAASKHTCRTRRGLHGWLRKPPSYLSDPNPDPDDRGAKRAETPTQLAKNIGSGKKTRGGRSRRSS